MVTDDALNAIFRFRFQRPSYKQSAGFCEELVRIVDGVVVDILATPAIQDEAGDVVMKDDDEDKHEDDEDNDTDDGDGQACDESTMHLDPLVYDRGVPLDVFTASDRMFLERARREYSARAGDAAAMPTKGEMWTEAWFPEYASALQMECVSAGTVALRLITLDGWKRVLHFLPGEECVHSAVPEVHDVLHCGQLEWADYADFGQQLRSALGAAKERKGTKRHATLGEGIGHQKTPAFLCAVMRSVLSEEEHEPTGGTTDVGMHTGGQPRDTCWPLVRSVLKQALPGSRGLFEKVHIRLQYTLVAGHLKLRAIEGVKEFWIAADMAFAMLQATVTSIVEMVDRGYICSRLEEECVRWREEMDSLIRAWGDHRERSFVLPDGEALEAIGSSPSLPVLSRPVREDLDSDLAAFTSGREKALKENQGYQVMDGKTCSTTRLVEYLRAASTSGVEDQVAVGQRMVETFMYGLASELGATSSVRVFKCSTLLEITNWYRRRRSSFAMKGKYDQTARVVTDSQLLLMSWIAFCLCHKVCCNLYPQLKKHRIALDWKRVGVAVLPEKEARTAFLQVTAYIQQWNSLDGRLPPVFNFSDPEGSVLLARTMGQEVNTYSAMYQQHLDEKRDQITAMWTNIQERKDRVKSLRADIADLRPRLARAQAELQEEQNDVELKQSLRQHVLYGRLNELVKRVGSLVASINEMERELSRKLKLHEFYVSPLPASKIDALAVLFLNYLPRSLDILSELCGLAQRELGLDDSAGYRASPPCNTSWSSHIDTYDRGSLKYYTQTKYTTAYPRELNVPDHYDPSSIDDVISRDHFARVSAWYPCGNSNHILWQERAKGSSGFVDRFRIPGSDSVSHFTSNLSADTEMAWSVSAPGGSTRGREPHLRQEPRGCCCA